MKRKASFNSNEILSNKEPRIEHDFIIVEDEAERTKRALKYVGESGKVFLEEDKENINPTAVSIKDKINKNSQENKSKYNGKLNSPIKLNTYSPRNVIVGLGNQNKATHVITHTFNLSGTNITEVRFKGNEQGGIINSLGSYDYILDKFTHITAFKGKTGKSIIYITDKAIIKANEKKLSLFLLKNIEALAKNNTKNNCLTLDNLFVINLNLKKYYDTYKNIKEIQKTFSNLLNFINRSIHNIVNHETSRRPSYDAENYPYVLSKSHILFSIRAGLTLVQEGHLNLKDIFAEDAQYNIVTGKNIEAQDVQLQEKFMLLYNLYVETKFPNKNCLLLPSYIREMFDIFSAPDDSPGRDYNQLIFNKTDEPHPREIHPADNCAAKRSLNLTY